MDPSKALRNPTYEVQNDPQLQSVGVSSLVLPPRATRIQQPSVSSSVASCLHLAPDPSTVVLGSGMERVSISCFGVCSGLLRKAAVGVWKDTKSEVPEPAGKPTECPGGSPARCAGGRVAEQALHLNFRHPNMLKSS